MLIEEKLSNAKDIVEIPIIFMKVNEIQKKQTNQNYGGIEI